MVPAHRTTSIRSTGRPWTRSSVRSRRRRHRSGRSPRLPQLALAGRALARVLLITSASEPRLALLVPDGQRQRLRSLDQGQGPGEAYGFERGGHRRSSDLARQNDQ